MSVTVCVGCGTLDAASSHCVLQTMQQSQDAAVIPAKHTRSEWERLAQHGPPSQELIQRQAETGSCQLSYAQLPSLTLPMLLRPNSRCTITFDTVDCPVDASLPLNHKHTCSCILCPMPGSTPPTLRHVLPIAGATMVGTRARDFSIGAVLEASTDVVPAASRKPQGAQKQQEPLPVEQDVGEPLRGKGCWGLGFGEGLLRVQESTRRCCRGDASGCFGQAGIFPLSGMGNGKKWDANRGGGGN
jgi:hypothetical protein